MAPSKIILASLTAAILAFSSQAMAYDRIISLYSGHTDNIIALGEQERLVAVSKNDEPQNRLSLLPHLPPKASPESFIALKPDLVILRDQNIRLNPDLADVLRRANIEVKVIEAPSWDGFEDYLRELAPLINAKPDKAAELFRDACQEIKREAVARGKGQSAPKVFVEATSKELHTVTDDSWAGHLIALCGGRNAASSSVPNRKGRGVAPWGLERTIQSAAEGLDVYLLQYGPMNRTTMDELKSRPWAGVLKNTRVAQIPEYEISRPSLLWLKKGAGKLLDIFYPQAQ